MGLFGKSPTMDEMVRKWKRELKREERALERSIRGSAARRVAALGSPARPRRPADQQRARVPAPLARRRVCVFRAARAEIDMQERKTEAEIKKCAAKKDMGSAKVSVGRSAPRQGRLLMVSNLAHRCWHANWSRVARRNNDSIRRVCCCVALVVAPIDDEQPRQSKANIRSVRSDRSVGRSSARPTRPTRPNDARSGIEMQLTQQVAAVRARVGPAEVRAARPR